MLNGRCFVNFVASGHSFLNVFSLVYHIATSISSVVTIISPEHITSMPNLCLCGRMRLFPSFLLSPSSSTRYQIPCMSGGSRPLP
ncbi:hypothetical protein BU26DRAFT_118823 [Trematosphaeria pertusa]|uniref:Uncharacterized protein n=1 Tax=Trematosphaeria pertusa TaxID=390896 RepID=A0A6A6HZ71_9PLEO|nr:uncharacterized protein BU26DRAFT_118823 [Trematosphaeria pertusa]KAF2243505.1 hypothetical protein BU26DRAFT_118823 [Trematosphaeria pertusa]